MNQCNNQITTFIFSVKINDIFLRKGYLKLLIFVIINKLTGLMLSDAIDNFISCY